MTGSLCDGPNVALLPAPNSSLMLTRMCLHEPRDQCCQIWRAPRMPTGRVQVILWDLLGASGGDRKARLSWRESAGLPVTLPPAQGGSVLSSVEAVFRRGRRAGVRLPAGRTWVLARTPALLVSRHEPRTVWRLGQATPIPPRHRFSRECGEGFGAAHFRRASPTGDVGRQRACALSAALTHVNRSRPDGIAAREVFAGGFEKNVRRLRLSSTARGEIYIATFSVGWSGVSRVHHAVGDAEGVGESEVNGSRSSRHGWGPSAFVPATSRRRGRVVQVAAEPPYSAHPNYGLNTWRRL